MSADADTMQALKGMWECNTPLQGALPFDRVHSDYTPARKGQALPMPYADVVCKRGKDALRQSPVTAGSPYCDFRLLTVTVRAVGKATADALLTLVRAALSERLAPTIPNATWVSTDVKDDHVEREKDRRFGEDVYKGVLQLEIASTRTEP